MGLAQGRRGASTWQSAPRARLRAVRRVGSVDPLAVPGIWRQQRLGREMDGPPLLVSANVTLGEGIRRARLCNRQGVYPVLPDYSGGDDPNGSRLEYHAIQPSKEIDGSDTIDDALPIRASSGRMRQPRSQRAINLARRRRRVHRSKGGSAARRLVARIGWLASGVAYSRRGSPFVDCGFVPCLSKRMRITVITSRSSGA